MALYQKVVDAFVVQDIIGVGNFIIFFMTFGAWHPITIILISLINVEDELAIWLELHSYFPFNTYSFLFPDLFFFLVLFSFGYPYQIALFVCILKKMSTDWSRDIFNHPSSMPAIWLCMKRLFRCWKVILIFSFGGGGHLFCRFEHSMQQFIFDCKSIELLDVPNPKFLSYEE